MVRIVLACLAAAGFVQADETVVKLNNGVEMPVVAFAAQVWSDDTCRNATSTALQAGFRYVWSSILVGQSCQIAQAEAIKSSGIDRKEIFIAGTVNTGGCSGTDGCYQQTLSDANAQFDLLGEDQLDMLMLDYPTSDCDGILGQWQAFEEIYSAGRVRSIAVSNFSPDEIECITSNQTATVPAVNQLHYSVGDGGSTMIEDNTKFGIVVQSYSPLNSGRLVRDTTCATIGATHGKSAVQVALKWILQTGGTIATQSTKLSHLIDDLAIFDFTLTDDEVGQLNAHSMADIVV